MFENELFRNITSKNKLSSPIESNQKPIIDYEAMHRNRIEGMSKGFEIMNTIKAGKEAEELRRHNELVEMAEKQVEYLAGLLADSKNAVEQRNAIIRFMVEGLINSEQPKEEKRKLLMDLLVPIATVSSGAADLMQLVKEGLEAIN